MLDILVIDQWQTNAIWNNNYQQSILKYNDNQIIILFISPVESCLQQQAKILANHISNALYLQHEFRLKT